MDFFRSRLADRGFTTNRALHRIKVDSHIAVAGLAVTRQRPGSARGVVFITLEDETGVANLIVWPDVFERHRETALAGQFLGVSGRLQRESGVIHLVSDCLHDFTPWLQELDQGLLAGPEPVDIRSRNFH